MLHAILLSAILVEPIEELRRKVAQDDARACDLASARNALSSTVSAALLTCPDHAFRRFVCHLPQSVDPLLSTCNHHCILPRNLISSHWVIGCDGGAVRDDVEVGKSGLDHEDVGPLGSIAPLQSIIVSRGKSIRGWQIRLTIARRAMPRPLGGS